MTFLLAHMFDIVIVLTVLYLVYLNLVLKGPMLQSLLVVVSLFLILILVPDWSVLLHALIGGVFVWSYVITKEKWWLPLICVQILAYAHEVLQLFPDAFFKVMSLMPWPPGDGSIPALIHCY